MEKRPNWRVVIFWMKRPAYVALIFILMVAAVILLDRYLLLWQGSISQHAGIEETTLIVVFCLVLSPMAIWNFLRWYTTTHDVLEKQLRLSKGIFNRKVYVANYEQIQNINVVRNFLERLLMLSTIRIETAGSKPGEAELEIEGVDSRYGEKLVHEISHLAEEAKEKRGKHIVVQDRTDLSELMDYSRKILAELREIKDLLSEENKEKTR